MEKMQGKDIKPFQFSDLENKDFSSESGFKPFSFATIVGESVNRTEITDDQIRVERSFAQKHNFKIDEIVKESRGLSRQEKNDLETRIEQEVKRRTEEAYNLAYKEGRELGIKEGQELAHQEYMQELNNRLEEIGQIVAGVQGQTDRILEKNRAEVYEFLKRFTKWIILKEIDEKVYLSGLLEKLILELNARKNLIIKVGKSNFSQMPEVIQAVESKLGHLVNTRVEIVPELNYPGIILEAENGLIDGSLEGVFQNMDKIFEQVLKNE
jgi:flagellar assembly protein FliH